MRLLCLTALLISGYLAKTSFQTGEVYGCSGGALIDCDHVLHSKYAKVLGIPVSVPAFALYATLLSVLFFFRKSTPESLLKTGWMVLTVGAISAAGAAIWFTGLQLADGKFCPYCLVAHCCGLVLATIVLSKNPLEKSQRVGFAAMSMTGVLALVAIQWKTEAPPTFTVESYPENPVKLGNTVEEAFGAPGEFAAPGSASEFDAPMTSSAPVEFSPPVFDAPGMDSGESDGNEDVDQSKQRAPNSRFAALVPPPVDITDTGKAENRFTGSRAPESEKTVTVEADLTRGIAKSSDNPSKDQSDVSLLPLEALEDEPISEPKTELAEFRSRSSVEYTPPMEVPVIFATDGAGIQRVDFRSENEDAGGPALENASPAEEPELAPSTSQRSETNRPKADAIRTAVSEPTGLQVSHTKNQAGNSPNAMAYLFFSASGATNAAVSQALFLNSQTATEEKKGKKSEAPEGPKKDRLVVVAGNLFSLNPKHWPLIGKPEAEFIFVEMFDYTCPHCRVTQKAIEGAFEEYGDRLAVITLPVPLERACNSTVNGMGTPGACEMAKLAVAVWRIERSKFADYHNYMCANQRSVAAARSKAEELVGKEKLDAEMKLPIAADYIKKHVELYRRVGQGSVPKLMFPRSTMTGEIQQAGVIVGAIKRELDQ